MRRVGSVTVLGLLLLSVLSASVLAHGQAASFSVKANHAAQGGQLTLQVKGKHSVKAAFTATAVVHFASGDMSVVLTRKGRSAEATVKVPVSATEQPGNVVVDFSITYPGGMRWLSANGVVNAAETDPEGDSGD